MRISILTSNMPRHVSLINRLAGIADTVYAVQECVTLFPGKVKDLIYAQSVPMKEYFDRVHWAEQSIFGHIRFTAPNVRTLSMKMADINDVGLDIFADALAADVIVVFGATYIKAPLIDALIEREAINIHMGVSPYFRGSSCNFWAINDGYPELVGATIHRLSRGLDSGDMMFHALPKPQACDPFLLGMKAVEAAHVALCDRIASGTLRGMPSVKQDRTQEIRYSRYTDFNDEVVKEYLKAIPDPDTIGQQVVANQGRHALLHPFYA